MRNFVRKYSVTSFYCITLIFSFILLMFHFVFQTVGKYSLSFTQFAPALAVLCIAYLLKDKTIRINIINHFQIDIISFKWLILSILIPVISIIISSLVLNYFSTDFIAWHGNTLFYILNFIAISMGCIAEEIGWRGFLLPNLQKKYNPLISSIIVGILWGLWHLNFSGGLLGFVLYTLTIIEMSICMSWLYNKTQGNLWLMSIWHICFNLASHIFLWERFNLSLFIVEFIVFGVLCIPLLMLDRKMFFTNPRIDNLSINK